MTFGNDSHLALASLLILIESQSLPHFEPESLYYLSLGQRPRYEIIINLSSEGATLLVRPIRA